MTIVEKLAKENLRRAYEQGFDDGANLLISDDPNNERIFVINGSYDKCKHSYWIQYKKTLKPKNA